MSWDGKTKGSVLGYKIFVIVLRYCGLLPAYFILFFVAAYYLFTSYKTNRFTYHFYRRGLRKSRVAAISTIFINYYTLGQTLIDKVAVLAGFDKKFVYLHEGNEDLASMLDSDKGCIIISAHVGNWEIAAEALNELGKNINIVMYDGEKKNIKAFMEEVMTQKRVNIIAIKNDYSHIYQILEALERREIICMHGDRYLPGSKTTRVPFLGIDTPFAAGLSALAVQLDIPVGFVFCMKEKIYQYRVICKKHIETSIQSIHADKRTKSDLLVAAYANVLSDVVKRYPHQWFNYYNIWDTKKL